MLYCFFVPWVWGFCEFLELEKLSTAFKQENVRVTYNGDKKPAVGDIRSGSLKTAEILPDERRITEVKNLLY